MSSGSGDPKKGTNMLSALRVLVVSVWALIPVTASAASAPDAILSGSAKGEFDVEECSISPKKAASIVDFEGRQALKIELRYEWEGCPNDWTRFGTPGFAQRMVYIHTAMRPGSEYWYKFSFYIPADLPKISDSILELIDVKHVLDNNGSVPTLQFAIWKEGVIFQSNMERPWTCGEFRLPNGALRTECNRTDAVGHMGTQADLSGRWIQMVAHFRWAKDDGVIEMWFDGVPTYGVHGDTVRGGKRFDIKFGAYRHHMHGDPGPATLYYSDIARATTCKDLKIDNCDKLAANPPTAGLQNLTGIRYDVDNALDESKVDAGQK
jgi:hypothetical protein